MREGRLIATLRKLREHGVEFVLVGGVAAVLQGAPVQTFDIDIVYSPDTGNLHRLMEFLRANDAVFRIQPERRLRPNETHLSARGHLNLMTPMGPLDLLGTIGDGLGFVDLLPRSTEMDVGAGVMVRVLDLETLIRVKEQLGTEKDLAALPVLRETLREIERRKR